MLKKDSDTNDQLARQTSQSNTVKIFVNYYLFNILWKFWSKFEKSLTVKFNNSKKTTIYCLNNVKGYKTK